MNEIEIQEWRVQRLKDAVDKVTNGNVTAFGKRLGYKGGAFVRQMLSRNRPVSEKTVRAVEELPGLARWFVRPLSLPSLNSPEAQVRRAEEEMEEERRDWEAEESRQRGSRHSEDAGYEPTEDEFALVPQLDIEIACGSGRFVDHVVVKGGLAFKRSSLRDFGVTEKTARIIYASGSSMAPYIQDGCVVLINTADIEPKEGKIYAICVPEGGMVLKRLIRDYHPNFGGLVWIMRSDNPDKIAHPDKVLPPDDRTMIAGRAIWNDNKL